MVTTEDADHYAGTCSTPVNIVYLVDPPFPNPCGPEDHHGGSQINEIVYNGGRICRSNLSVRRFVCPKHISHQECVCLHDVYICRWVWAEVCIA